MFLYICEQSRILIGLVQSLFVIVEEPDGLYVLNVRQLHLDPLVVRLLVERPSVYQIGIKEDAVPGSARDAGRLVRQEESVIERVTLVDHVETPVHGLQIKDYRVTGMFLFLIVHVRVKVSVTRVDPRLFNQEDVILKHIGRS